MTTDKISRRTLGGLAAAGVGVPLLAACGSDDPESAADPSASPSSSAASTSSPPSDGTSSSTPSESSSSAAGGGKALAQASDIEVGGGEVFADEEVVVTQPTEGEFKCFTAICSHQGCLVADVSDGTINCDCHGSKYNIENGDVEEGPATFALAEVPITVTGDEITLS